MKPRFVKLGVTLLGFAAALLTVGCANHGPLQAATSPPTWAGRWNIESQPFWGGADAFTLAKKGTAVTGRHGLKFYAETNKGGGIVACETRTGGTIRGTARGRKLKGTITFPNAKGVVYLTLSPNGREIIGQMNVVRGPCATAWASFNAKRQK